MSKEFQIRDGNLIASFDLENEDGDIDFCKLLKVSHGVAEEIGMFVDYVATNKIIKDQSKKIAVLETKLAEKDEQLLYKSWYKQYKNVMEANEGFYNECAKLREQLAEKEKEIENLNNRILISQLQAPEEQRLKIIGSSCCQYNPKRDEISFAIDELEKVKETTECILDNALKNSSLNQSYYDRLLDEIDNQIKQLKEMK